MRFALSMFWASPAAWMDEVTDQGMDGWHRDPTVWVLSPGLHWVEITSPAGGCKTLDSPGRHQARLTGVFSNLTIVCEGLHFGLLSHYTVMAAIFCLGICLFLWGNTCQNVFESTIYHRQFVKIVRLHFHGQRSFRKLSQLSTGSKEENVFFQWDAVRKNSIPHLHHFFENWLENLRGEACGQSLLFYFCWPDVRILQHHLKPNSWNIWGINFSPPDMSNSSFFIME